MDVSQKKFLKELDHQVIAFMNKYVLSGLALGVVQDGKLIYSKGFGLADAASREPVTPNTVFRIASISKTFTAIGVMQLWEKGMFQLDDPINKHLKSYKVLHPDPAAPPVTIRHMLTHTSGIGEMRSNRDLLRELAASTFGIRLKDETYAPGEQPVPLAEYYHGVLAPDVFPEQKWAYANNAYATLGQLIEDLSGQPFPQYMIEHVFEPLGMKKTDFLLSERVRHELAQGYGFDKGRLKPREYFGFPGMAAGSVHSSVNEMALYLAALMNGGANDHGSVIKPATLEMMMSPQYNQHPHLAAMGLGFFLEELDGHTGAWHGGALPGFNSSMWVSPKDRVGLIVWANTETRAIYNFGENVLRGLLALPEYSQRLPKKGGLAPTHLYPQFVSVYGPRPGFNSNSRIWMGFGGETEIYVKDNKLMLRAFGGPYARGIELHPVDPADPLLFENVTDGKLLRLAFQRNAEGFIDRFSISNLTFATFYRREKTQSLRFLLKAGISVVCGLAAGIAGFCLLRRKCGKKCC